MIDADALTEALERPTVKIGNTVYTGEILSIEQWAPFAEKLAKTVDDEVTAAESFKLTRGYLRAVFPYRMSYRWKGDPVDLIMASPVLQEILADFFGCQVRAMTGKTQHLKTNGTDLPSSQ